MPGADAEEMMGEIGGRGIGKEKRYIEMENFFFDNSGHFSLKGILFYVHSMHKIPLRDLK